MTEHEITPPINNSTRNGFDYRLILNFQAATDIRQLWSYFFQGLGTFINIEHARLVYRIGVLFEQIDTDSSGSTFNILTNFHFIDSRKEFDFDLTGEKAYFFMRQDSDIIQLDIDCKERGAITADELETYLVDFIHIFFNQVYLLLRLKNFEYHAVKDDITMAYNQNYLKAFIQNEIERSRRFASMFSIIFFDLDNLKSINDIHGHLVGTEILKEVASLLRSQVRKVDVLSRFGGDEFVIVLLHADASRAYDVSQRIRKAINNHEFLKTQDLKLHISGCFGISSFPFNGATPEELIRKADIAMYEVKRAGKNGIKIYEGDQ